MPPRKLPTNDLQTINHTTSDCASVIWYRFLNVGKAAKELALHPASLKKAFRKYVSGKPFFAQVTTLYLCVKYFLGGFIIDIRYMGYPCLLFGFAITGEEIGPGDLVHGEFPGAGHQLL